MRGATAITAKGQPAYLRLALSEFRIIDRFQGFHDHGDRSNETKPGHKPFIEANWRYDRVSDKLILNGDEIEPGTIEISLASHREDTELSRADHNGLVLYMIQSAFLPLVQRIRQADVEQATLILRAEPHEKTTEILRLVFGNVSIETYQKSLPGRSVSKEDIAGITRRLEIILYWVVFVLAFIAFLLLRHHMT
jgi:hypothetical protein